MRLTPMVLRVCLDLSMNIQIPLLAVWQISSKGILIHGILGDIFSDFGALSSQDLITSLSMYFGERTNGCS